MVIIKDDALTIKIFLDNGLLIHAEGIDKDTALIKEIGNRKGFSSDQLDILLQIKKNDPHSLGKALIDHQLISRSAWEKYLVIRAKYHLAAALKMDVVKLGFTEAKSPIARISLVNRNFFELLLDAIRDIKDQAFFKKYIPEKQACFEKTDKGRDLEDWITLTSNEHVVLSVIDGQKTIEGISTATDLDLKDLYQIFYLLSFLGLIVHVKKAPKEKSGVDHMEIIHLYLDFLKILEIYFRKEVGKQFDTIFDQCMKELTEKGDKFFQGIDSAGEPLEKVAIKISERFSNLLISGETLLVLSSSLNKLIYLLIMRMNKTLGRRITEIALNEMLKMMGYAEKYSQDSEMTNYIRGNLEDYLRQVGA